MRKTITENKWLLLLFIVLFILRVTSPASADMSFIVLALLAILGGKYLIFSFLLSWFFTLLNPVLSPEGTLASLARYLMIILGLINVIIYSAQNRKTKIKKYVFWLCVLNLILVTHSIIVSYEVSISILKILSWFIAAFVLINTWARITEEDKENLYQFIILILKLVTILSLPLFLIPEIGFAKNGTGFQGLLNHPQAFGPTMALLGTIMVGKILANKKLLFSETIWFFGCLVLIILSQARTAGLALVLGILLSLLLNPILIKKGFFEANPILKNKNIYLWLIIIIGITGLASPLYIENIKSYIFKRSEYSNVTELADESRGALVKDMLHNISEKPILGIGFGVASDPNSLEVTRDPIFNLPISATIEKGVLPIAIIEELGIFVGIIVFIWLFYSLRKAAKYNIQSLTVLMCILCLNLGEYMFFSIGGMGMLMLIFFAKSVSD